MLKNIGRFQRVHLTEIVEPVTHALYSRVLGWDENQIKIFMAGIKKELNDRDLHLYTIFRYLWGRKPE